MRKNNIIGASFASFSNQYSFNFNGTNNYISIPDNNSLSFGNGITDSPFSISAWVKMNDATLFRIFSKMNTSNEEYMFTTSGTKQLGLFLMNQGAGTNIIARSFTPLMSAYVGQWIHLVGTYSGNSATSGIKLYLNGSRIDDANFTAGGTYVAMSNTSATARIGSVSRSAGTAYANGKIDEVSLWNKELSLSEVQEIYNSGLPDNLNKHSASANIVSWWRMGEGATWDGSNWQVPDTNGSNNATSVNMAEADRVSDVP